MNTTRLTHPGKQEPGAKNLPGAAKKKAPPEGEAKTVLATVMDGNPPAIECGFHSANITGGPMELEIIGQELAHRIILTMLLAESRLDLDIMHKGLTDSLQAHAPHGSEPEAQTLTRYIEAACTELDGIFADAARRRTPPSP